MEKDKPFWIRKTTLIISSLLLLFTETCGEVNLTCPSECNCYGSMNELVSCTNRNLQHIPEALGIHITTLDLGNNDFDMLINDSFIRLSVLKKLYMNDNHLEAIEIHAFRGLGQLSILDLSHNYLLSLSRVSFLDSSNLTELYLQGNPLQVLPELQPFLSIVSLEDLDVSDCKLRTIPPSAFGNLGNLKTLNLSGNRLTTLKSDSLSHMRHLGKLILSDNPWYCDCSLAEFGSWYSGHFGVPVEARCFSPDHLAGKSCVEVFKDDACLETTEGLYNDSKSNNLTELIPNYIVTRTDMNKPGLIKLMSSDVEKPMRNYNVTTDSSVLHIWNIVNITVLSFCATIGLYMIFSFGLMTYRKYGPFTLPCCIGRKGTNEDTQFPLDLLEETVVSPAGDSGYETII